MTCRVDPVAFLVGEAEVRHHACADAVEKVLLVGDVVVEGHGLDADLARHAAHRDRLDPLGVHDLQRRVDHTLPGEALSRLDGRSGLRGHGLRPFG